MAVPSGPSQIPAMALPHDDKSRREFMYTNRFTFTAKGVVALIIVCSAALVGIYLLQSAHWYIGVAVMLIAALIFFGPMRWSGGTESNRRVPKD